VAQYLRDEQISNITVDETMLRDLSEVFEQRGLLMPEYKETKVDEAPSILYHFTLRFDQKGYRIYIIESLLDYYRRAKEVERVIFNLDSPKSISTNKIVGSYANLHLIKMKIIIVS